MAHTTIKLTNVPENPAFSVLLEEVRGKCEQVGEVVIEELTDRNTNGVTVEVRFSATHEESLMVDAMSAANDLRKMLETVCESVVLHATTFVEQNQLDRLSDEVVMYSQFGR